MINFLILLAFSDVGDVQSYKCCLVFPETVVGVAYKHVNQNTLVAVPARVGRSPTCSFSNKTYKAYPHHVENGLTVLVIPDSSEIKLSVTSHALPGPITAITPRGLTR